MLGGAAVWLAARLLQYAVAGVMVLAHPAIGRDGFFGLFQRWDALQFGRIAADGYFGPGVGQAYQAYFPGYPLAVRAVASVLVGPDPAEHQLGVALWLVPLVASLAASILFWRIAADRFGDRVALGADVLLLAGPYSVFLLADYSEALFLAFGLAGWYAASRGRWLAAGLLLAGASFTRINGAFLVVGAMVLFAIVARRAGRRWLVRTLALGALGVAGTAAYFGYLWAMTGDLLAWTHAQYVGWGRITQPPWRTLRRTVAEATAWSDPFHTQYWFDLVFAVLLLIAGIVLLVQRRWPDLVYVALTAIPLATSLSYLSLARNCLLVFPLPLLLASALRSRRWRPLFWVGVAVAVAVGVFTTSELVQGHWAD